MNDFQATAGYVPPLTGSPLNSVSISRAGRTWPTHTAAARCGVKPANHASL